MSKILLDECLPINFKHYFAEHECVTVSDLGLAGKKNGELLLLAEADGFEVFITQDHGRIPAARPFSLILLSFWQPLQLTQR